MAKAKTNSQKQADRITETATNGITVKPYKMSVVFIAQLIDPDGTVRQELTLTNQGQPFEFFNADDIAAVGQALAADAQNQLNNPQPAQAA